MSIINEYIIELDNLDENFELDLNTLNDDRKYIEELRKQNKKLDEELKNKQRLFEELEE